MYQTQPQSQNERQIKKESEQPYSKPALHEEKLTSYGICRSLMNNVLAKWLSEWMQWLQYILVPS